MLRRLSLLLPSALLAFALLAPAAMADPHDGGQGWLGEVDDLTVTKAGFILIALYPLFILMMSLLQWRLEKRKDRRKATARSRATDPVWKGGW